MGGANASGRVTRALPLATGGLAKGRGFRRRGTRRRVTLEDESARDTEVTTNRKRTKKITVRDAEPNRTRSHHEQQRQGRGTAEAVVGGVALPGASGREPRVPVRQKWGELRRPPRPAAVSGAASAAFVIPELQLLASPWPFPPSTLWRSLALRSRGWGS